MVNTIIMLRICLTYRLHAEFKMESMGSVLNIYRNISMVFMLMFEKNSLLTSNK